MLVNPLKAVKPEKTIGITDSRVNRIVGDLQGYLINYHSDLLSDVTINTENNKMTEKVIREKIFRDYSHVNIDVNELVKRVLDKFFGYSILQKHLEDINVSDIRLNAFNSIRVKRKGRWYNTGQSFMDGYEYYNFVRYCVLKNGGKITEETPSVRVSDRVNMLRITASIPPVNVSPPSLVIRIHRPEVFSSLDDLFTGESFMMDLEIYDFLIKAVASGCNIVVAGPSASGKTTLLRALINRLPEDLAITINEENAELFSNHPNVIQRQIIDSREQEKNIDLEQLSREALLMTNDVIVVGEIKGPETLVLFDAMSTGHICYTTVHSNKAELTLDRIVLLMKKNPLAQQYTDKYLRELLAESVDLVVYLRKFRVVEIAEVIYEKKAGTISFNPLYRFSVKEYVDGEMKGIFRTVGKPRQKVKDKFTQHQNEFERLFRGDMDE